MAKTKNSETKMMQEFVVTTSLVPKEESQTNLDDTIIKHVWKHSDEECLSLEYVFDFSIGFDKKKIKRVINKPESNKKITHKKLIQSVHDAIGKLLSEYVAEHYFSKIKSDSK